MGLWNLISLGGSICMQIVWQGAIIFEYYLNMFEFNYFIFSLLKSQISYFLASNFRTKGIISYIYIYIYIDSISLRSFHSMQVYKCDDSEDARIHKVLLCLIFLGFCTYIDTGIWYFNSRCATFFPTPNQRNWKES